MENKGMMSISIPNTKEGKQTLQSLLDKGWNVCFSLAEAESADGEVVSTRVFLDRRKREPLEYGWYSIKRKELI